MKKFNLGILVLVLSTSLASASDCPRESLITDLPVHDKIVSIQFQMGTRVGAFQKHIVLENSIFAMKGTSDRPYPIPEQYRVRVYKVDSHFIHAYQDPFDVFAFWSPAGHAEEIKGKTIADFEEASGKQLTIVCEDFKEI